MLDVAAAVVCNKVPAAGALYHRKEPVEEADAFNATLPFPHRSALVTVSKLLANK